MTTYQKNIFFGDKVNADIKNEFDSNPDYNEIFLKNKIRSHDDKVTDFSDNKIPQVDSKHTCLAAISLEPTLIFKKDIEKKVIRHIIDDLESSSNSDESDE